MAKRTGHLPLRARIVASGETLTSVAQKAGLAQATLAAKLLNYRPFTVREIKGIAEALHLSDAEIIKYFFKEEE